MAILNNLSKDPERGERLLEDTKTYLSQRYDLLKLELLGKSSQLLSIILSMLIVVVCGLAMLIYLSSALISWLSAVWSPALAYITVCGVFVLIIVFVLLKKDKLFVNPLIKKFSKVLFKEYDQEQEGGTDE